MPRPPISISKILPVFLIVLSLLIQFKITRGQIVENDFCQDHLALNQTPIYQLFPVSRCWKNSKFLATQYPAHPPTTLLFIIPFSKLALYQATLVWDILNISLYFLTTIIFLIYLKKFNSQNLAIFSIISIFLSSVFLAFTTRNLNIILLLLLTLGFVKKNGFLIGIASLFKLWPVIFLLDKKLIKSGAITIISGNLLALLIFGFQNYSDYFKKVIPYEHVFSNFANNLSLTSSLNKINYGLAHYYFYPIYPPSNYQNIFNLLFILVICLLPKKFKFLNLLILYLVFSPLTWDSSMILYLLPLVLIIKKLPAFKNHLIYITLGFFPFLFPAFLELPTFLLAGFPTLLYSIIFIFTCLPLLINKALSDIIKP